MLDPRDPYMFTAQDFRNRAVARGLPLDTGILPLSASSRIDLGMTEAADVRDALCGVTVAVVDRPEGATVLLTKRAGHLKSHAGQIAFPGGKVEPGDASLTHTALREAREEIGLPAAFTDPVAIMPVHRTGTGFRIAAILAVVKPGFPLTLDTGEVDEVFEAPLSHLMTAANHETHTGVWQGVERQYYAIPYGERFIWGATAAILKSIHDRLYL